MVFRINNRDVSKPTFLHI